MGHRYRQLKVWQKAHQLTLAVYRATRTFPREEIYGLTSQIRRAAVSIEANQAEGAGRFGRAELRHFVNIAAGSAAELDCELLIAHDLGYLESDEHERFEAAIDEVC